VRFSIWENWRIILSWIFVKINFYSLKCWVSWRICFAPRRHFDSLETIIFESGLQLTRIGIDCYSKKDWKQWFILFPQLWWVSLYAFTKLSSNQIRDWRELTNHNSKAI
jgi:hypothetical protein